MGFAAKTANPFLVMTTLTGLSSGPYSEWRSDSLAGMKRLFVRRPEKLSEETVGHDGRDHY